MVGNLGHHRVVSVWLDPQARHSVAATLRAAVVIQKSTGWQACPGFKDIKFLNCGGGTAGLSAPVSSHILGYPGVTPVTWNADLPPTLIPALGSH